MSYYWDNKFLQHLKDNDIRTIFEVGARYGDESKKLKLTFPNSKIYSFECNPNTIEICKKNLNNIEDIHFYDFGLGDKECDLPFYSYTQNNDGASSLLKRIDFEFTQRETGLINILKGAGNFIKNIKYIIMEEPKAIINTDYLPTGMHSKYINAPTSKEIKDFMFKNNFIQIESIEENAIEDNVMYKNNNL